jgi:hypothetical protein
MRSQTCQACGRGLTDEPGPALFDHHGYWYHLACWCKHMDAQIAGESEALATRKALTERTAADCRNRVKSSGPPDPA